MDDSSLRSLLFLIGFIVLFPIGIGIWLLAKGARAWFLPAGLGIWMYWRVTRKA
jgi:hypothetical protein